MTQQADLTKNADTIKSLGQVSAKVNMKYIESDLLKTYSKIDSFNGSSDSVYSVDSLFEVKLLFYTSHYPQTLTYNFKLLNGPVGIITSSDSLFRIYTWDDMLGGTDRFNMNIFQYSIAGKVESCNFRYRDNYNKDSEYVTDHFTHIYTLNTTERKFYLVTLMDEGSNRDRYEGIMAFTIDAVGLHIAQIIKTKKGLQNNIGYGYDFFSNNSEDFIYFDEHTKNIYLPVVLEDAHGYGRKTNNYTVYHFKGKFFDRIQN